MSEYIFPIIWADIFLVSVDLSWNALWTTGMIKARDGASIKWTKRVSNNADRHGEVFLVGSWSASSKVGTIAIQREVKNQLIQMWNFYIVMMTGMY